MRVDTPISPLAWSETLLSSPMQDPANWFSQLVGDRVLDC